MTRAPRNPRSNDGDRRLAEVVADAVVAAYVHKISDRHGAAAPEEESMTQASESD